MRAPTSRPARRPRTASPGRVLRLHFAKTLAGPPVKLVREVDGEAVFTMTLIHHAVEPPAKEAKPADE